MAHHATGYSLLGREKFRQGLGFDFFAGLTAGLDVKNLQGRIDLNQNTDMGVSTRPLRGDGAALDSATQSEDYIPLAEIGNRDIDITIGHRTIG